MNLELTGKLKAKTGMKMVGANQDFKVLDFWLDVSENGRENIVQLQLAGDNGVGLLNEVEAGDTIKVNFAINGRKYTTKEGKESFFQSMTAFKVAKLRIEQQGTPPPPPLANDDNDLPF